LKKVASATDPLHASLLIGVLEDYGIEAIVQGEALWGARGELPLTPESAPSIWVVHDEDAQPALEALAKHEVDKNVAVCRACGCDLRGRTKAQCPECGTSLPESDNWICADCGERCDAQFTHCWSCGKQKVDEEVEIVFGSERISTEEAARAGLPKPLCPFCRGTGVRTHRALPATFVILAFALAMIFLRGIDFPRFQYISLRLIPDVLGFSFFGGLSLFMAYKCRTWKCSCCEDD